MRAPLARIVRTSALAPGISSISASTRFNRCHRLAGKHGDALAQGLGEVDFAPHAAHGDGGDVFAQPRESGELVDELAGDDGRFHVGHQKALAPAGAFLDGEVNGGAVEPLANGGLDCCRIGMGKGNVTGNSRREPIGSVNLAPISPSIFAAAPAISGSPLAPIKVRT